MIQEIVIYILLGIALFFLFSKFWKKIKKKGACDTNCDC
nr:FeoB-associated Cys-rich membrane protein [Flavicella sediminum]